jgi:hypothetical protein
MLFLTLKRKTHFIKILNPEKSTMANMEVLSKALIPILAG